MSTSTGFFSRQPAIQKTWHDSGTVYQALAISICDHLLISPFMSSHPEPGITKLLNIFFEQHSGLVSNTPETALTDFRSLLKDENKCAQGVRLLSETLYHMTLEGLFQHPTHYHEFALPSEKREYPAHWIANSAPAVIASSLNLCIHVSTIASGKSLPAKVQYGPEHFISFHLRVRHERYSAFILSEELKAILPEKTVPELDAPILDKLTKVLGVEINNTLEEFEKIYDQLLKMVKAGELTKEFLLELYINCLSVRLPTGTQAFFDSIHIEDAEHTPHMIPELIHAITRMICLGEIRKEQVYGHIDGLDYPQGQTHALHSF